MLTNIPLVFRLVYYSFLRSISLIFVLVTYLLTGLFLVDRLFYCSLLLSVPPPFRLTQLLVI